MSQAEHVHQDGRVYRDDKWLVVPLDSSGLPNTCLWSNTPAEGEFKEVEIIDPNAGYEFGFLHGFRLKTNRRKIRLPGSENSEDAIALKKKMLSRKVLKFSIPYLIVGFAVIAAMVSTMTHPQLTSTTGTVMFFAAVIVGGLGLIGTIIALAIPYLEGVGVEDAPVRVGLITDTHFWLPKAHPDILNAAPPWSGVTRAEHLANRPSFLRSAVQAWPVLVGWLLIVAMFALIRAIIRFST